ncbi:MAG TPA: EamA family transporter [Baekduia sp.]|uniref:EamA family transporter n=1 Tax=Baekduia sp. TaxID=2600305 RepID=UPI002D7971DF|nr:EamA family transporter [Baekduia sp.]HET6510481.1 EamA family transporter [Baekduia sp.]
MAIALALAAAVSWGTADFLAGLASRRVSVPVVLFLVEGGGLVVILAITLVSGKPFFDDASDFWSALGGGLSGVLGLGCFYAALSIGTMSVVAPISSAGVGLPVVVGIATGNRPSAVTALGLAAIVAGVVLASREEHADSEAAASSRRAVALALVSAIGFGGFFALTDAPSDASVPWTLVIARSAALPFVALIIARGRPRLPTRKLGLGIAAVGTVDLLATALIAIANTKGDLSVVSVLGGMYPVMTVMLAAAVLKERVAAPQVLGIVLALGGVGAVAAG